MNEGTAIVIAAILSPAITLGISSIVSYLRLKKEREERFFYEIFPKRLELYEEIIRVTDFIGYDKKALLLDSPERVPDYFKDKKIALVDLSIPCITCGSPIVLHAINNLIEEFDILTNQILTKPLELNMEAGPPFITSKAVKIKMHLLELIREEAGGCIIDKKISDFLRDVKKQKKIDKNIDNKK